MAKTTGPAWPPMRMPDDVVLYPDYPHKPDPGPDSGFGMPPLVTAAITGILICGAALVVLLGVAVAGLLGWI